MPKLGKINFNSNFYEAYLRNIFCEMLSFSSLAFEKEFNCVKQSLEELKKFGSKENSQYALKLDQGNEEDKQLLIQRFQEISDYLTYKGIPSAKIFNEEIDDYNPSVHEFKAYYSGAIRPYRNKLELETARQQGKLQGFDYEEETVLEKAGILYSLIYAKIQADYKARLLKKGNNEAFMYSLSLPKIEMKDIIDINAILNNSVGISGLRNINNTIQKCPFETTPKEFVRSSLEQLLNSYYNDWILTIPQGDIENMSDEEYQAYQKAVCMREAMFHIEFERIHPFEDGNGRTGRIILCKNLIKMGMAPIIITPEMREVYIGFINNRDYTGLSNFIYFLSSVTLTNMISEYRKAKGIKPDELDLVKTPDTKLMK